MADMQTLINSAQLAAADGTVAEPEKILTRAELLKKLRDKKTKSIALRTKGTIQKARDQMEEGHGQIKQQIRELFQRFNIDEATHQKEMAQLYGALKKGDRNVAQQIMGPLIADSVKKNGGVSSE